MVQQPISLTSILVVSYVFPNYPGVGGRRWAKFSKYLSKKGFDVHVISAQNELEGISFWESDVQGNDRIHRYPLPSRFPRVLLRSPQNLPDRLYYRFEKARMERKVPGNFYDRAFFFGQEWIPKAKELIERYNIRNVFVTGGPFHLLHQALYLKQIFPKLNLVIDFRDPWIEDLKTRGLLPARLMFEEGLEREAVLGADQVVTVTDEMTQNLRARYPGAKVITIYNGFDPDEMLQRSTPKDQPIRLILTGEIYGDLEHLVFPFLEMLKDLKRNQRDIYQSFQIRWVGRVAPKYRDFIQNQELDVIQVEDFLPIQEVHREISEAHFGMSFIPEHRLFSFGGTKMIEYLGHRKKILVISKDGEFPRYVVQHGVGFHVKPSSMKEDFLSFVHRANSGEGRFPDDFNVEQYSLPRLTDQLIETLKG